MFIRRIPSTRTATQKIIFFSEAPQSLSNVIFHVTLAHWQFLVILLETVRTVVDEEFKCFGKWADFQKIIPHYKAFFGTIIAPDILCGSTMETPQPLIFFIYMTYAATGAACWAIEWKVLYKKFHHCSSCHTPQKIDFFITTTTGV